MQKKILLTRPKSASEKWAKILAERGFESMIDPLLIIEPIAINKPEGEFQAVMITSANLFDAVAKNNYWIQDYFSLPCFCVGEATGQAAREFGFKDVKCGDSDSSALAHKIISENNDIQSITVHQPSFPRKRESIAAQPAPHLMRGLRGKISQRQTGHLLEILTHALAIARRWIPAFAGMTYGKSQNILHLCGEIVDEKAGNILHEGNITLTPCPVYRARAAEDFSKATRAALSNNGISAIPLFSPRSAKILVSLLEKNRLTHCCSSITVIGLSQAVADVLGTVEWRRLLVAASPSEAEMLICLGNAAHDTDGNAS